MQEHIEGFRQMRQYQKFLIEVVPGIKFIYVVFLLTHISSLYNFTSKYNFHIMHDY